MRRKMLILLSILLIFFLFSCTPSEKKTDNQDFYDMINPMWEDYAYRAYLRGEFNIQEIEEITFLGKIEYIENLTYRSYAEYFYLNNHTQFASVQMIVTFKEDSNLPTHLYEYSWSGLRKDSSYVKQYGGGTLRPSNEVLNVQAHKENLRTEISDYLENRMTIMEPMLKEDSVYEAAYIDIDFTYEELRSYVKPIESMYTHEGFVYVLYEDQHAEVIGYTQDLSQSNPQMLDEILGYPVTKIKNHAFKNASTSRMKLSRNLEEIGSYAFIDAYMFYLEIPKSVQRIEDFAFHRTLLHDFTFEEESQLTHIGNYVFEDATIHHLRIPKSVKHMGSYAFHNIKKVYTIEVEEGNQYYQSMDGVLYNKNKTILIAYPTHKVETSFIVPASVVFIHHSAFRYTSYLRHIDFELNSQLKFIGPSAFSHTHISTMFIPRSVSVIGDRAFLGTSQLSWIEVDQRNKSYQSKDGILFNKDLTELIYYPSGNPLSSYEVPRSVYKLHDHAFYGAKNLTDITFEAGTVIHSIGDYAFGLTSIKSIIIPITVERVGFYIFYYVTGLENVYVRAESRKAGWAIDWLFDQDMVTWGYKE